MNSKLNYGVITQEKPFYLEGNSIYFRNKNGFGIDFAGIRSPDAALTSVIIEALNKTYQVGFDEGVSTMSKLVASMQEAQKVSA
jgi:hypothetical protein